jgi:hypothetical protein
MTDTTASAPPPNHLLEYILGVLAPFLMAGSITDIHFARLAATEAIAAYKADGQAELVTIGRILAFALTALDNLRLSVAPDLSLSMKLKLRGNASALDRSARSNTRMLADTRRQLTPPDPSIAEQAAMTAWDAMATWDTPESNHDPESNHNSDSTPYPKSILTPVPDHDAPPTSSDPQPITQRPGAAPAFQAATTTEQQDRLIWANAMNTEAARLQATFATTRPAQQKANRLWVDVLTGVARDLTGGKAPTAPQDPSGPQDPTGPQKMTRSELMRTTLLTGGATFPAHLSRR